MGLILTPPCPGLLTDMACHLHAPADIVPLLPEGAPWARYEGMCRLTVE